jgi:3-deoxy-manno-octulosonate cytidylyltransferase (CMP-KDO synthetase)
MNPILMIPARMASTRLPGKPLADIAGRPMIVRVWEQAMASGLGPVVVAAAEPEIVAAIEAAGGRAVLTDPGLASGSDRIHAALTLIDPPVAGAVRHHVVINLQGDLPALGPDAIRAVAQALTESGADIATLAAEIDDPADRDNPAVVKAVVAWSASEQGADTSKKETGGRLGRALYFTRVCAPSGDGPLFHHVGIYAYRRDALTRFVALPPSPLEKREKLEQLRALEANMSIAVARVDRVPLSVDTPADLQRANRLLSP